MNHIWHHDDPVITRLGARSPNNNDAQASSPVYNCNMLFDQIQGKVRNFYLDNNLSPL